jgi:tetratricopeptide (TPR) repeat protein
MHRFKIMRGDNYLEVTPLLEMARTMCDALCKGEKGTRMEDKILNDFLETFLLLFHHHYGVLELHTNNPQQSLYHCKAFTEGLRAKFGADRPVGGTDQSLGKAWNELGNAYLQNGSLSEAEDSFRKSIEALRCLSHSTAISINMPLINLAFCFWLQGRLQDAESTFNGALSARETVYGVDDTTSLM